MGLGRVFLCSLAAGAFGVIALAAWTGNAQIAPPAPPPATNRPLTDNVSVRDQIALRDVAAIKAAGYRVLVDIRPDGEAPGQPPAAAVAEEASKLGMTFAYVPTPNGAEPDATVEHLSRVLAAADGPVLLYCRSGNRAARIWALSEASRKDGLPAAQISAATRRAGHSVDDLNAKIEARIASREKP